MRAINPSRASRASTERFNKSYDKAIRERWDIENLLYPVGIELVARVCERAHIPFPHIALFEWTGIFHIGFESEGLNSGLAAAMRASRRIRLCHSFRSSPPASRRRKAMVNARENGKIDRAARPTFSCRA